jgi:exodeoxyribonuclease-3
VKIATFNINSIRGRVARLHELLDEAKPDVVCVQELRIYHEEFPIASIRAAGYGALWQGQKPRYNGVAILARGAEPVEVRRTLPGDPADAQARYLEAAVNGVLVGALYAPNGNPQPGPKFDYKLAWLDRLIRHAAGLYASGVPVVLAGDYNVVPTGRDIYETRSCSRKAAPRFAGCSTRDGWTPFARGIRRRRSTRTGITCASAGSAMRACASIICC